MGNKRRIIRDIAPYFPGHRMRIELFFGAGGSYFYLPKPKYAVLNDLDDDVANLYITVQNRFEELMYEIRILPLSESLIDHWKVTSETDPVRKSIRFLFLSNFTYLGTGDTLRVGLDNAKERLLKSMHPTFLWLSNAKIVNRDFREVLPCISFTKGVNDKENCFVYLDPVYLGTEYNYRVPKWRRDDTADCVELIASCGIKAAMSEFDHPFVLDQCRKHGLNVIRLGERVNIKNRRHEILITNYFTQQIALEL